MSGACVCDPACKEGSKCVSGACVDETGCSPACEAGSKCVSGACITETGCSPACEAGTECVSGVCIAKTGCSPACSGGSSCVGSTCIYDQQSLITMWTPTGVVVGEFVTSDGVRTYVNEGVCAPGKAIIADYVEFSTATIDVRLDVNGEYRISLTNPALNFTMGSFAENKFNVSLGSFTTEMDVPVGATSLDMQILIDVVIEPGRIGYNIVLKTTTNLVSAGFVLARTLDYVKGTMIVNAIDGTARVAMTGAPPITNYPRSEDIIPFEASTKGIESAITGSGSILIPETQQIYTYVFIPNQGGNQTIDLGKFVVPSTPEMVKAVNMVLTFYSGVFFTVNNNLAARLELSSHDKSVQVDVINRVASQQREYIALPETTTFPLTANVYMTRDNTDFLALTVRIGEVSVKIVSATQWTTESFITLIDFAGPDVTQATLLRIPAR